MIRGLISAFIGTALLIACAGATAPKLIAAEAINEGTGITLTLVIGAIGLVAVGAWKLGQWVTKEAEHSAKQDEQIAELRRMLEDKHRS